MLLLRELVLFIEFPPLPPDDAFVAVIGPEPLFSLPFCEDVLRVEPLSLCGLRLLSSF